MRTIRFLLTLLILAIPAALFGQFGISVRIGPPALPMYEQPMCPGDGYLWTPGYWAYDQDISDYYWVPGTWVMAPEVGYLWTPGYWGWSGNGYYFNEGYWGQTVGFYGGVQYGYGYYGDGYSGGRWDHDHFYYNRSESRVDERNFHNVYDERVNRGPETRVSYNGGNGGINVHATPQQEVAGRERHIAPIAVQHENVQSARDNPELRASANHGNPSVSAVSKQEERVAHAAPARPGVDANRPGPAGEPNKNAGGEPNKNVGGEPNKGVAGEPNKGVGGEANVPHAPVHPKDLPPIARPAPVNSGNAKADKQYEQKQNQMIAQQTQQREALQQKQDAEHQRTMNANAQQQLEQKHQQQTQQMAQKHEAQQQQMQTHQPQSHKPPNPPPPPPK